MHEKSSALLNGRKQYVFCHCWGYCHIHLDINLQTSKGNKKVTNLRHITTKTTSSIKATPEPAPIAIYVVCSSPVRIIN